MDGEHCARRSLWGSYLEGPDSLQVALIKAFSTSGTRTEVSSSSKPTSQAASTVPTIMTYLAYSVVGLRAGGISPEPARAPKEGPAFINIWAGALCPGLTVCGGIISGAWTALERTPNFVNCALSSPPPVPPLRENTTAWTRTQPRTRGGKAAGP